MTTASPAHPPTLKAVVRFTSFASLHRAAGEQLAQGSLYLPLDLAAAQYAAVDVLVEAPDGQRFPVACEVLQAFPGLATALTVKPAGRPALDALLQHVASHPPEGDPGAALEAFLPGSELDAPGDGAVDEAAADDASDDGADVRSPTTDVDTPSSSSDLSLVQQLAAMSTGEKRQAALHGGKEMRGLVLKELNKGLHPFVLRNPAITLDEVEQISKLTSVNPEVLHICAREWSRSSTVVRNLVKNPKTPMPDALALIDKLALGDLKAIVKGSAVRMPLLMAARKRLKE